MNDKIRGANPNRRTILGGGTALAGAGLAGLLAGCTPGNPRPATSASLPAAAPSEPLKVPHVVLLGINGGPGWYPDVQPAGISTAVVVGDATYVVDVGDRAPSQYMIANPNGNKEYEEFANLRGLFLTHLHSDHTIDYFKMFNYGWWNGLDLIKDPVKVMGPGRRKTLTPAFDEDKVPQPASPSNPMPGTVDMTDAVFDAYATDINDRVRDNGFINLRDLIDVEDIKIPGYAVGLETKKKMPAMDPFDIYEDDRVKVTAILVDHYPVFPAFAFRFDTEGAPWSFPVIPARRRISAESPKEQTCSCMRSSMINGSIPCTRTRPESVSTFFQHIHRLPNWVKLPKKQELGNWS